MKVRTKQPEGSGVTRIRPRVGHLFTADRIGGEWRATGTAEGTNIFGVLWQDAKGRAWWIALHDFDTASQRLLIKQCESEDRGKRA